MNIGIIGFGAIGQVLSSLIETHAQNVRVVAIVAQPSHHPELRARLPESAVLAATVDEMLRCNPDLVVECAGHVALGSMGPQVLRTGIDLLVASVGALADLSIESALRKAALSSGARIRIPAGALGGLDVLSAARLVGLDSVTYVSSKAPGAWKGTAAENMIDLEGLTQPSIFFTGNARDAALQFPKNANVAAAVALAGAGFERTHVRLTADPSATGNRHRIHAVGVFGEIEVTILGRTVPSNPKTSILAPYSIVHDLANLSGTFVIG